MAFDVKFYVTGLNLQIGSSRTISGGSNNPLSMKFKFSDDWDPYHPDDATKHMKRVEFVYSDGNRVTAMLDEADEIPESMNVKLKTGSCKVSVVGFDRVINSETGTITDTDVKRTNDLSITITVPTRPQIAPLPHPGHHHGHHPVLSPEEAMFCRLNNLEAQVLKLKDSLVSGGLGSATGADINDEVVYTTKTWSSTKIRSTINSKAAELQEEFNTKIAQLNNDSSDKTDGVESGLIEKIDSVESTLGTKIDTAEAVLDTKINTVNTDLSDRIDEVSTNLSNSVTSNTEKFTEIETEFTQVNSHLESVDSSIADNAADILELKTSKVSMINGIRPDEDGNVSVTIDNAVLGTMTTPQIRLETGTYINRVIFEDLKVNDKLTVTNLTIDKPEAQGSDWHFSSEEGKLKMTGVVNEPCLVTLALIADQSSAYVMSITQVFTDGNLVQAPSSSAVFNRFKSFESELADAILDNYVGKFS